MTTLTIYNILEMSFDKRKKKEFQTRILRNELLTIGEKFHRTALKWLEETRKLYINNSAEFQTHPNRILSDLRKINHERAYIAYKISSLDKERKLPSPKKLRQKLRKMEMEVKFQEEFPDEYKQFTEKLRDGLKSKPYSPLIKAKRSKTCCQKDIPIKWNIPLGKRIRFMKSKISKRKTSADVNNTIKIINDGKSTLMNNNSGHPKLPMITKNKIENLLGISITNSMFKQFKNKMNKQKLRKHGHVKRALNFQKCIKL